MDACAEVGHHPDLELRSARLAPDYLALELHVLDRSGELHSRWELRCWGVLEYQVPFGIIESPCIEDDHPWLIEHTEPHTELFFSGPVSDPVQAVGALANAHHSVFGRWRAFSSYLNPAMAISQVLSYPRGTIGRGPVSALRAYDAALKSLGISTSIVNERPAVHREDSLPGRPTPEGIFIMTFGEDPMDRPDEPFVIAQGFSATRLADDKWWTASFRVISKTVTTTEMSRRLGLSPSRVNDLHRSVWVLNSGLPSTEPLERHLAELLDVLEPIATTLSQLQQEGCRTDFFVGIGSETGSARSGGADLDAALLRRIAALGTDLGLNLYPPQA
jgi:hypothetical protein